MVAIFVSVQKKWIGKTTVGKARPNTKKSCKIPDMNQLQKINKSPSVSVTIPWLCKKKKKKSLIFPDAWQLLLVQGCHIGDGPKFPDISLTIPWHITIFPWQFTLHYFSKLKTTII